MTIGEYVKNYRKTHGLTMQAFADKSGLSRSYISILERGVHPQNGKKVVPTITTIRMLSEAMNLSINDLLSITDPTDIRLQAEPVYEAAAGEGLYGDGTPSDEYNPRLRDDEVYVKVKGSSMEPTLQDGDLVVIAATSVLDYPRQIALVKVNGDEATIKRAEAKDDGLLLIGDNVDVYPPHFYTAGEVQDLPVTIEGVVTRLIREVK